jgi:hypothetical protein
VLCRFIILLHVITRAWLWLIIKSQTFCTLHKKKFSLIDVLLPHFAIYLLITTRYLTHRSSTTTKQTCSLFRVSPASNTFAELTAFTHILRDSSQSLQTNLAIANHISSRPNFLILHIHYEISLLSHGASLPELLINVIK